MGSPRAATLRQIERGQRCWSCQKWLGNPKPVDFGRQRRCEACEPRRHRVLLTFGPSRAHAVEFLAEDAKTPIGRRLYIQGNEALEGFVTRAGGDPEELAKAIRQWGQGSVWLNLTDEQYERLTGRKQPKGVNKP